MKFSKIAAFLSASFATAFVFGSAPLTARSALDVYTPTVTSPLQGTIWTVGEIQNVTWDTSNPPAQISNPKGVLYLRSRDYTTPLILAKDFNILQGFALLTVPDVREDKYYSCVLFGDSGNYSPMFTITGSGVTF